MPFFVAKTTLCELHFFKSDLYLTEHDSSAANAAEGTNAANFCCKHASECCKSANECSAESVFHQNAIDEAQLSKYGAK